MRFAVRLAPHAEADLERLAAFLVDSSPATAARAVERIKAALQTLSAFPFRTRDHGDGRRELLIPFGSAAYVAKYAVVGRDVLVTRIYHSREHR